MSSSWGDSWFDIWSMKLELLSACLASGKFQQVPVWFPRLSVVTMGFSVVGASQLRSSFPSKQSMTPSHRWVGRTHWPFPQSKIVLLQSRKVERRNKVSAAQFVSSVLSWQWSVPSHKNDVETQPDPSGHSQSFKEQPPVQIRKRRSLFVSSQ